MIKINFKAIILGLCILCLLTGCSERPIIVQDIQGDDIAETVQAPVIASVIPEMECNNLSKGEEPTNLPDIFPVTAPEFDFDSVPDFCGQASVVVNGNQPFFTETDTWDSGFEYYSPLDALGRCGVT